LLFVSGQVALDAEGRLVGRSDFVGQVRQSFENMKTVLAAGGASLNDLVKLTYFVVGLDETRVKTLRTLRNEILPVVGRPASTLLGVSALAEEGMLIEIEGIAELPESNA
jgi:enamine deaminase RidA (YjgF/YER057c/UK114 family)